MGPTIDSVTSCWACAEELPRGATKCAACGESVPTCWACAEVLPRGAQECPSCNHLASSSRSS